jgi:hypothetical protein
MYLLHLAMAVLASFRLTELFAVDKITAKLREKFPSYLWQCVRCLSVWAGAATTLAFIFCPWLNWPFAMSWFFFVGQDLVAAYRARKGKQFLAVLKQNGQGNVLRCDFLPEEVANMCNSLLIAPEPKKEN